METTPVSPDEQQPTAAKRGPDWRFALLLTIVLCAILVSQRARLADESHPSTATTDALVPPEEPAGQTVALAVDFGNGTRWSWAALPWQEGMTIEDALQLAATYHPGVEYTQVGSGAQGMLTAIAGISNEGTAGSNWIIFVNSTAIRQSFCLEKLLPGDAVEWRFTSGAPDE